MCEELEHKLKYNNNEIDNGIPVTKFTFGK